MNRYRTELFRVIRMACVILCYSGVHAFSQPTVMTETQAALVLDLETALKIALAWNTDVQRADLDVQSSTVNADQMMRRFHPSLSFSGGSSARWIEPSFPGADSVTHSATIRLSSGYTVFNGFANHSNRDASLAELNSTEWTAERVMETTVYYVISRIFDVAAAMEQIMVQEQNVAAQKEMLDRITAFYESGRRPVADLYQQRAETSAAEFRLITVMRDFELKKLALLDRLGLSAGLRVDIVTEGLEKVRQSIEPLPELRESLAHAFEKRSDYLAVLASVQAVQHAVRAAKSGYWPDVSLSMDTGTTYSGGSHASWTDQFVRDNPYASIGVTVGLPLYDRGQTRNAVAQADIRVRRANLARHDLERLIEREITTAYLEYRTAQKQLESALVRIDYTAQALENYEQRYTVNAATLLEVIQARAQHLSALYEKIAAEYNLTDKAVAIRYYMGDMTPLTGRVASSGTSLVEGNVL